MASSVTSTDQRLRLTLRDIAALISIGKYKYLTTQQLRRLHFTNNHDLSTNHRMLQLRRAGFVDRRKIYPTDEDGSTGSRSAVYFLRPNNVRNIIAHLLARGRPELIGALQDLPTIDKHSNIFAHAPLQHEVGVSEVLLTLHEAAQLTGDRLLFFEQTSRMKKLQERYEDTEIAAEGKTKRRRVTFSPDGVFCYLHEASRTLSFPCIEFDNDSESLETWRAKVTAYLRFSAAGRTPGFIRSFSDRYDLNFSDDLCRGVDVPVLTVAATIYRRDQLIRETSRLSDQAQRERFFFVALEELTPQTICNAVWLNADQYRPLYDQERQLPKGMHRSVREAWRIERIQALPRVSFLG